MHRLNQKKKNNPTNDKNTEFKIGESVYLKTDTDQGLRMVVEIVISCDSVRYFIAKGTERGWYSPIEISRHKNELLSLGLDKMELDN